MSMKWSTEDSSPNHLTTLKRPWRKAMLAIMCSALLFTAGCSLLPDEDVEEVLPEITPPTISKKPELDVVKDTLETAVSFGGKLMSEQEEPLYFTLGNKRIKEVLVSNGDSVKAGQVIAVLDLEDMEKDLRNKRLQLRQDEVQMKETLRQKDEMDPVQFEEAQIAFEEKRQAITDLEEDIAKGTLTAPFDGTIMSLSMQKGQMTKEYETVAIVADTSRLTVAADMSKDDQKKISLGMEAEVRVNNVDTPLKGKVKSLPATVPNNNGGSGGNVQQERLENYVVIQVEKMPSGLQRGTPLSGKIIVQRRKDVTLIPMSALRTIGSRTYVQVVDENGKREVDVEVGQQTSTHVEILKGLEPGQKVVGR
ncbi:efflux RND transporter periplasmic adaptor subunit [Paenibacillus marinisediminis]